MDEYLGQDDDAPSSVPYVVTSVENWKELIRERAIQEVTGDGAVDADVVDDDDDDDDVYDVDLPKSSIKNLKIALNVATDMRLFKEEIQNDESGDLVHQLTKKLETLNMKKK